MCSDGNLESLNRNSVINITEIENGFLLFDSILLNRAKHLVLYGLFYRVFSFMNFIAGRFR